MGDHVETMIEKLKTTENHVIKSSLIEQLGNTGDHRALKPVLESLNDADTLVRWRAIRAISNFGDDAAALLMKQLDTDDAYLRRNIVQAMGEIGGEMVTDKLIRMLMFDESDKNVLIEIIRSLHKLHPRRAVEPLITILKSNDWEMRWRSIHTLGRIGDPKAIEPLLEIMNDNDPDIRWAATVAVDNIKNSEINKELEPEAKPKPAPPLPEKPDRPASGPAPELGLTTSAPIGQIVIHVDGEINSDNAKIFSGFAEGVMSTSTDPITIDFGKCDFIDSFGLSILNNIRKKMKSKRRQLKLKGLNPNLMSVFSATKLDSLFEIE